MIPAVLANLVLGLAFAWAGRDRVRADGPFAAPAFLLVLTHVALVTAPVTLYFYVAHPDWSWLYLVDPARVPGLAIVPLVVGHGLLVAGSWYGGALMIRLDRPRVLVWTIAGVGGAFLLCVGLFLPRLVTATTYAGWRAGATGRLMGVELGWALLVSIAATAGAAGYVIVELLRDSRRVRAR